MKILHIIDSLSVGGAEKLIVDSIPLMVEKGIEVDVALLKQTDSAFYNELREKECCNIINLGTSLFNPLHLYKIIRLFNKDYDLIHVHLFPANYFTALAKKITFSKVPLIFTEHSTGNKRMDNKRFRWIESWIYKSYQKAICITPEVKQNVIEKLNIDDGKLTVIQNGINLTTIRNAIPNKREDFNLTDKDCLLIMVASFRTQKDQDTLINTIKELPDKYKLLLVGDGPRREVLEALVSELKIQDRVILMGIRSDVYPLIKMSDIAVLSSHWEGFGLAAAEAMACGVPVIASNVDGLAQVVEGGGILFEKGDVLDLRNKVLSLEDENYYNQIAISGIEKAKQYSIEKMVEGYVGLYEREVDR